MFALVDKWKSFDTTQQQFFTEHDLNVGAFSYWVAKHKPAGSADPVGGSVNVDVFGSADSVPVRITYSNGVVVSCPAEPDLIGRLTHLA